MNDQTDRENQHHAGGNDELAPAAGGTFGVTKDESGFGQGPVTDELARDRAPIDESGASYSGANYSPDAPAYGSVPREYSDAAGEDNNELQTDEFISAQDTAQPAQHGYATEREDNYPADAADTYGIPANAGTTGASNEHGGFAQYAADAGATNISNDQTTMGAAGAAYSQAAPYGYGDSAEATPTMYGNEPTTPANSTLPIIAVIFAVLALGLLCLPGIAWMFGGAAGVIAVITGFMATRTAQPATTNKQFGWLAVAGGGIAIALAVATAIVVYLV